VICENEGTGDINSHFSRSANLMNNSMRVLIAIFVVNTAVGIWGAQSQSDTSQVSLLNLTLTTYF
jgi:hypothetical protein